MNVVVMISVVFGGISGASVAFLSGYGPVHVVVAYPLGGFVAVVTVLTAALIRQGKANSR